MSKAVPWSIKGVAAETREAARDAARRSGLSIGEWLNAVVADHASENGLDLDDLDEQERLEAVTARLARLSNRPQEGRGRYRRGDTPSARWPGREPEAEEAEDESDVVPVRRSRRPPPSHSDARETSFARAKTIRSDGDSEETPDRSARSPRAGAEERRSTLDRIGERLTDLDRHLRSGPARQAEPVRDLVSRLEERLSGRDRAIADEEGERTRAALDRVTNKLEDLERRLVEDEASEAQAVRDALERLETRLAAPQEPAPSPFDDQLKQLDRKLSELADRVSRPPAAPQAAPSAPAAQAEAPWRAFSPAPMRSSRDGIDRAIAEIASRQRALDAPEGPGSASPAASPPRAAEFSQPPAAPLAGAPRPLPARERPPAPFAPREWASHEVGSQDVRSLEPESQTWPPLPVRDRGADRAAEAANEATRTKMEELAAAVARLGEQIDGLSDRRADEDALLAPLRTLASDLRDAATSRSEPYEAIHRELSALGAKMSASAFDPAFLRAVAAQAQEIRDLLAAALSRQPVAAALDARLADIDRRLDGLARSAPDRENLAQTLAGLEDLRASLADGGQQRGLLQALDARFADLSHRLDERARAEAATKVGEFDRRLDALHRDLTDRLDEKAQDDRRLMNSLRDEISSKLERPDAVVDPQRLESLLADVARQFAKPPQADFSRLERSLQGLEERLSARPVLVDEDALARAFKEAAADLPVPVPPAPSFDAQALEAAIRDLAVSLSQGATADLNKVESLVHGLSERVEDIADRLDQPAPLSQALIEQVSQLSSRLDAVLDPAAGAQALDALRAQIESLSSRLEGSEEGLRVIADMKSSMGALFSSLGDLHDGAVDAARAAARDVAAQMIGPDIRSDLIDQQVSAIREAQSASEQRVHHTLTVVHDTLHKMVDRLTSLEQNAAMPVTLASGPAPVFASPRETPAAGRPDVGSLGGLRPSDLMQDELIEPGTRFSMGKRLQSEEPVTKSQGAAFITAARRAVSSGAAMREDSLDERAEAKARARAAAARLAHDEPAEAQPLQRVRQFVQTRKRPLLFGAAAVLLALCSLQVVGALLSRHAANPVQSAAPAVRPAFPSARPATAPAPAKPDHSALLLAPKPVAGAPAFASKATALSLPTFAAGSLVPPDIDRLRKGAEGGDPGSAYALALRYAEGRGVVMDPGQALRWFQKAADAHVALAAYRVGLMYEKGLGAPRDVAAAMSWYRKAAAAGNARAMHNLAVLSAQAGDRGGPDYASAVTWFARAAAYGVRDSQYNLAILYARGLGTERNLAQAYVWFALAGAQGDADAVQKRDQVGARLTPAQLDWAKGRVQGFHPLVPSASANDAPAPGPEQNISADRSDRSKSPPGV